MRPKVIFVDDCEGLRHLVSLLFAEEGISCRCLSSYDEVVANGKEVLESEAVVIDVNLSGANDDGVSVYDWLRKNSYAGTSFFLTGHSKESPQVRRAEMTGLPVLEKPMPPEELIGILKNAISRG